MSFQGQLNFGYPVTSQNIITNVPDNAVLPLSIGSSLQGNVLGVTFGDLKSQAAPSLYDADRNTFVGQFAFENGSLTGAYNNTAIGYTALSSVISDVAYNNTAIGMASLFTNTVGYGNTAIGGSALYSCTTGASNTAIGIGSLSGLTVTNFNTAVGGGTQATGEGSVILGYNASSTGNNQFVVGSSGTNAGAITTETITANRTWTVRINGANYKIPLLAI